MKIGDTVTIPHPLYDTEVARYPRLTGQVASFDDDVVCVMVCEGGALGSMVWRPHFVLRKDVVEEARERE